LCFGAQRSKYLLSSLGCKKPKKGFQYGQKSDTFRPLQRIPLLSFSPFDLIKRLEPWIPFDKRLTWKAHLPNAETKARKKLAILRKLAGTNWGAHEKILKTVYLGTVRPILEYGSSAFMTTAKTNQHRLDKIQNKALRIITGAMKLTPIKAMENSTAITPLAKRRETKILIQTRKYLFLPDHLQGLTNNRF
jgi:hypothetical protein